MARRHRQELEGGVFHVYARGNAKGAIFRDDSDRRAYLGLLARAVRHCGWVLHAYCLMENHIHLLVETPHPNLGKGMQFLHGTYARDFNDRHGRSGHLFQGRYGSVLMKDDNQFQIVKGYIELNPVTAGLCDAAEDWPWSAAFRGSDPQNC
jgi:REP element-mobilizing transposase RayT